MATGRERSSSSRFATAVFMFLRLIVPLLLTSGLTSLVSAQSLLSSGETKPDGGRPKSTQVGFFELMESGGDAMLDWFKPAGHQHDVESPEYHSQASPRDTVMTFLEAMNHVVQGRRDPLPRATDCLPNATDSKEQVANDLLQVFDRLPEIRPGLLPGPQTVQQEQISRYELFPRGIENAWAYDALGKAPEGKIVLVQHDGHWVFSRDTAAGVDALLDSMKDIPPRTRTQRKGQLFLSVVEPTFRKTAALDWLFAMAWAIGGIACGWLIYKLVNRLIEKRESCGDDLITPMLTSLMIPAVILVAVFGLAIGSAKIFMHPVLSNFRWNIIEAAIVLAGVYLLVSVIELACLGIRRSFFDNTDPYARMMSLVVRRGLRVIATIVLLLFVFQNVFKWNVAALIGGFSIVALALSLAAQDAVKNLFGALTIFANRPFIDGDWVKFDREIGEVQDVSLQVTRIRLLSGQILSVPNMKFIDNPVENLSMRKYLRRMMDVQITYDTPADKVDEAISILQDILTSEEVVSDGQSDLEAHPPRVWFDQFGAHYLNLRADYWYMMDKEFTRVQRDTERGWFSYLDHATRVNRMVLERFNEAGIDFAFPTQSVYLTDDPDRNLTIQTRQLQEAF